MMLRLLDYFFTLLHLLIIGFNLLGWIWPSLRRLHFLIVLLTAGSWLILGIWYGIGYCPITDWQWQIKERLGEVSLPDSFIKYLADKVTQRDIPSSIIDILTAGCFAIAVVLTLWLNFFKRNQSEKVKNIK